MSETALPLGPYDTGRQPCDSFHARRETNAYASWDNVHECFGPYPRLPGQETCAGHVSFCENCTSDHHGGGWDSCPVARAALEGDPQ